MRHRAFFDNSMIVISISVALGVAATMMPTQAMTADQLAQATDQPQTPADAGLVRTTNTRSRIVDMKPGTDWSRFKTIQLMSLEVPPDSRDAAPGGARTRMQESFVLQDKDVQDMQAAFAQSMRTVLGQAGFTFVDTPQADTLIVGPMITDITLTAPISNTHASGRTRTYTRGRGSISIAAVLADGTTGEVLGRVAAASRPSNMWRINNRVTNMSDARTAFNQWARSLSDTIRSGNSDVGR